MKTVYRPLSKLDTTTPKPKTKSQGNFQSMLSEHLKQVRTANASKTGQTQTNKENQSLDLDENLTALKELDTEYYTKGLSKKTLAQTFSARNSSKLEVRLDKYKHLIESKAKKYNLDPTLLAGLLKQESNFNPYAVSNCGAMGLGQLMPDTARYLGVKDPFNAAQNIDGAAKYLSEQLKTFGGSIDKALAAYNAGPGAVKKYGGIPPYRETQNYVRSIRSHMREIASKDFFSKKSIA